MYNKWHNTFKPCPLCNKIPDDIFHIIIDCKFTKTMWKRVERVLLKIIPIQVTDTEKALGLQPRRQSETQATILRNWITFSLRHLIMLEERRAFAIKDYHTHSVEKFFIKFNFKTLKELKLKKLQYEHRNASELFENIVTTKMAVAEIENGEYIWKTLM